MNNSKILSILILLVFLTACNSVNNTSDTNDITDNEATEQHENTENEKVHQEEPQSETETEEEPELEVEEIVLPDEVLQKGDRGDSVQLVQQALIEIGYELTPSDLFNREIVWAITDLQLQSEKLLVTGIYDEETKQFLETFLENEEKITPGKGLAFKEDEPLDDETVVIANPYEILALINKQHALPSDYVPEDLVVPNVPFPFVEDLPKKQMRKVAADALEEMFKVAELASLDLFAQSGYRSYERQEVLFATYVSNHGEEEANTFSARPGESEHQSGLTMDVTSPHVNYRLVTDFGETEEGIWLKEHAAEFGFIIRYPKGKENITQYQYEPWHLRYVGVKAATEIMEREITLEEYLEEKLAN